MKLVEMNPPLGESYLLMLCDTWQTQSNPTKEWTQQRPLPKLSKPY